MQASAFRWGKLRCRSVSIFSAWQPGQIFSEKTHSCEQSEQTSRRCPFRTLTIGARALGYGPREGLLRLRGLIAEDLRRQGVPALAENMIRLLEPIRARAAEWKAHPERVREVLADGAAKARRMLGWRARFDLDTGLRETVQWYERYCGAQV